MVARKPPPQTLSAAQRDAAAATLRELAKAIHASAADSWTHVTVVGDLAALVTRLTMRLPAEWGAQASARLAEQLRRNSSPRSALSALLHIQTLIAGALSVPEPGGELAEAAQAAYQGSQHLLAALVTSDRERHGHHLGQADAHLAAAHARLAAWRNAPHPRSGGDHGPATRKQAS